MSTQCATKRKDQPDDDVECGFHGATVAAPDVGECGDGGAWFVYLAPYDSDHYKMVG